MSNTPRTEAAVIKDIHGNEVLHDGCRIIRATEMAQMENELSEMRKELHNMHEKFNIQARDLRLLTRKLTRACNSR
jgi:hypothetical protein